jgi:hypothetical protein
LRLARTENAGDEQNAEGPHRHYVGRQTLTDEANKDRHVQHDDCGDLNEFQDHETPPLPAN